MVSSTRVRFIFWNVLEFFNHGLILLESVHVSLLSDGLILLYYGVIEYIEMAAIMAILVSNKTWIQDYECP